MLRIYRHYIPALVFVTIAVDLAVIVSAMLFAAWIGFPNGVGALWSKMVVLAAVNILALYLADLYQLDFRIRRVELASRLLVALLVSVTTSAAIGFVLPALGLGRLAFIFTYSFVALGLLASRLTWLALGPTRQLRHRVLVLGVGPAASALPELQFSRTRPFTIVGFLDDAPDAADRIPTGFALLGKTKDLRNLTDELRPDLILVALGEMRRALPADELLECRLQGINVEDWPTFYEKQTGKILVTNLRPSWLIFSDGFKKTNTTQMVKRAMDVALAFTALVLSLPPMAIVACAIRLDSKGPILFRQQRVGERGRVFVLKKFRSMTVDAERDGPVWATARDPRVTRVGRWLRRSRLDELPQFWNVLAGDMSFVGPRPERPEFVETLQREIPFYRGRHSVRPGITGWAQVRHPYAASVEDSMEKLQYDLYYIKNLSPLLDLVVLLSTLQVVLFGRGARECRPLEHRRRSKGSQRANSMGSWSQSSPERLVRGVIHRRKRLVLGTSLIALVLLLPAAFIASKEPQRYRSGAVVLLEAQPGRVPGGVFPDMVPNRPFPVLMAILGSRSLAESVVEGLPRASFQELIETSYQPNLWQSIWSAYLGWRGVEVPVSSPSRRALAELQRARVTFQPWPEKSGIVTIVAEASRPNVAVDIVNAYIEALMSRTRTFNIDDSRVSREFLEQHLTDIKRTLNVSEQALQVFVASHGGIRLPDQSRAAADRLASLEARMAEAVSNRKMVETRREALREKLDSQKRAGTPSRMCTTDLERTRNQLAQLESSLLDLQMRYTEEHPRIQLVKNRIDELTNLMSSVLKECVVSTPSPSAVPAAERLNFSDQFIALESTHQTMLAQEEALQRQTEVLRQSLKGLSGGEAEYARLSRDVESQRGLYTMLSEKLTAARIREHGEMKVVKVIDPASSPVPAGNEKRMMALAIAFAAALGVGAAVPAAVEWLHRKIENEDDVDLATGLPVLALIPRIRGGRPMFMSGVPENGQGPSDQLMFTEAFRALRVGIELSTRGEPLKRLLVTSAFADEGKSTVVANLGLALNESGRRVVLADTDFLRPTLHKTMKIKSSRGLIETLDSDDPLEPILVPVTQGLWLAQRGESVQPRTRGMLAGTRLPEIIGEMSKRADFVICDSSPVLLIRDNLLLASAVDGVILVAKAGSTGFRDLARAKNLLEGAGAKVLGVVLNQVPVRPLRKYYLRYYNSYVKAERK